MKELKLMSQKGRLSKYEIGNYEVIVELNKDEKVECMVISPNNYNDKHVARIHFNGFEKEFEIFTINYQQELLNADDLNKYIKAYQEALEVVEVLEKKFLK